MDRIPPVAAVIPTYRHPNRKKRILPKNSGLIISRRHFFIDALRWVHSGVKKGEASIKSFPFSWNSGAGNESRTRDLNLGKVALYQLSYSRNIFFENGQNGAGNESRTRDLNLGKVALYQLSYSRLRSSKMKNYTDLFRICQRSFPRTP